VVCRSNQPARRGPTSPISRSGPGQSGESKHPGCPRWRSSPPTPRRPTSLHAPTVSRSPRGLHCRDSRDLVDLPVRAGVDPAGRRWKANPRGRHPAPRTRMPLQHDGIGRMTASAWQCRSRWSPVAQSCGSPRWSHQRALVSFVDPLESPGSCMSVASSANSSICWVRNRRSFSVAARWAARWNAALCGPWLPEPTQPPGPRAPFGPPAFRQPIQARFASDLIFNNGREPAPS
jgi:hypothetical protein